MGQFTSSSSNRKDRSLPTTEPTPKSISSDTERSTASMPRSDSARFTSASQSHKPKHSYSNSTPRAGAPSVISEASSARTGTGTASSMTAPARRHTEAAFSTTNTTRPPTVKRTDSNTLRQKPSRRPSTRKPALIRRPTFQTEYMDMLLHLDTIPRLHNIYASAFGWILLAGFLVLPGTFASLKDREAELDADKGNKAQIEAEVLHAVNNVPLLAIAIACCAIGGIGLFWLWMVWRRNYVWSLNRIFLPGFLNSLAGVISTLINIYTARAGEYSITARVTIAVTGGCTVVLFLLFAFYNFILLQRVKSRHRKAVEQAGGSVDANGEAVDEGGIAGLTEKVKRKAKRPGAEPESVV